MGGNKGFVEISGISKTKNLAHGLSASTGDINNDGWTDIYVTNDYDKPDFLYVNNADGTFKNTIHESFKHISNFSMGSDIADFDNDGNLDIMVVDMVAEDHKRIKTNMSGMNPEDFSEVNNKNNDFHDERKDELPKENVYDELWGIFPEEWKQKFPNEFEKPYFTNLVQKLNEDNQNKLNIFQNFKVIN